MDKKYETKKKKSLSKFAKEHKKEITIGVLAIGTIVTNIVMYKMQYSFKSSSDIFDDINLDVDPVEECIPKLFLEADIDKKCDNDNNYISRNINVPEYIRKLPKDYKHSQNAVESAKRLGYDLLDDETFVRQYSYTKIGA